MENQTRLKHILSVIEDLKKQGHKPMTLLGACPNSISVIKASFRAAKRNNAPIIGTVGKCREFLNKLIDNVMEFSYI